MTSLAQDPVESTEIQRVATSPISVDSAMSEMTIQQITSRVNKINALLSTLMEPGKHYGKIPGCGDKPALHQPGAQLILMMFRMAPKFEIQIDDLGDRHREYKVTVALTDQVSGIFIGEGTGSCSTLESKYRYRNSGRICPKCKQEAIIKGKAQYGGGWVCWRNKGGCGIEFSDGDKSIEDQNPGRVENPDIADQWNTVLKMGCKRALIHAALTATGASAQFTQDMDEFEEWADKVASEYTDASPESPKKTAPDAETVIAWYVASSVPQEELELFLDKPVERWTPEDTRKLQELAYEIRDGKKKKSELFGGYVKGLREKITELAMSLPSERAQKILVSHGVEKGIEGLDEINSPGVLRATATALQNEADRQSKEQSKKPPVKKGDGEPGSLLPDDDGSAKGQAAFGK